MKALPVLPGDSVSEMARALQSMSPDSLRLPELRDAFYLATVDRVLTCLAQYTEDTTVQEPFLQHLYQTIPASLALYPIHEPFYAWAATWVRTSWESAVRAVATPTPKAPKAPPVYLTKEQCPYQLGRVVCDSVDAALKKAEIRPSPGAHRLRLRECGNCQLGPVTEALAKDPTPKHHAFLRALGFSFYYPHSGPGLPTAPYHCPLVGADIVEPCAATACSHHVDYPWSNNCLRIHVIQHGPATTPHEIAILLNRPVSEVAQGLTQAMKNARSQVLNEQRREGKIEPDFEDIRTTARTLCLACEKPLPRADLQVKSKGESYCSQSCLHALPPAYARVERSYGRTYRSMVQYARATFSSPEDAYNVLGLPLPAHHTVASPHIPEHAPVELLRSSSPNAKGVSILKRTGRKPTWLTDLEQVLTRRLAALRIPGFELVME